MTSLSSQRPPDVDFLERRLRALEQRVQELEAARGLPVSSFRGGSLTFFDTARLTRLALGNIDLDGSISGITTAYGNFTYGDGASPNPASPGAIILAFRSGDRGWTYPDLPIPLHAPAGIAVTSATFTGLLEAEVVFPSHEVAYLEGAVITDATTTGEIRVRESLSGQVTSTLSVPANTNGRYSFEWLQPATTGLFDPRARLATNLALALDARRASGAGSFLVFPPLNAVMTSLFLHPHATAAGNPLLA